MNRQKPTIDLNRRTYLKAAGIAATGTVGLAGCAGTASATGTLATQVTDQPGDIADFESCVVTIQGIWVKPSGGDDDTDEDLRRVLNAVEQGVMDVDEAADALE